MNRHITSLIFLSVISISSLFLLEAPLNAVPAQVVILRHAEKPPEGDELDLKGRARAAALAPYFIGSSMVFQFGTPVAIFAQKPDRKHTSLRPIQTITPLASSLNLSVNTSYEQDQYPEMATEILTNVKYDGKLVIICWSHDVIPEMSKTFGVVDAPTKWKSKVFDRLWVLTYGNGIVQFQDLPQCLMYEDSSK